MKSVAVFCSASSTIDPKIFAAAERFAEGLASRGLELVYGGASVGLMGRFADVALKHGGVVRGAITRGLADSSREMAHTGLQELVIVEDLFERKRWMMDRSDAFVLFPGGLGTLDEALEVITWRALGCHRKPIVFVNVGGFWQSQIKVFEEFERAGMIRGRASDLFDVCDSVDDVFTCLERGS